MKMWFQRWAWAIGRWLMAWGRPPDVESDAQREDRLRRDFQGRVEDRIDLILDLLLLEYTAPVGPRLDETLVPEVLTDAQSLMLLSPEGHVEYEVAWHRPRVPPSFTHGGVTYHRRAERGADAWEFVR